MGKAPGVSASLKKKQDAAALKMETVGKDFTPEMVESWKEIGLSRPEWIPLTDWEMGEDLTPKQTMICKCTALMMTRQQVSELTGASESYIDNVINSRVGKAEIESVQDKFLSNTKKMLDDILPLAIKTAFQVMLDPKTKPQVKADAAFRFMDRVMGRPTQQVEVSTNLIRQVYEKLDATEANKVVDITIKRIENAAIETKPEEVVSEPADPVDAWVKENLQ